MDNFQFLQLNGGINRQEKGWEQHAHLLIVGGFCTVYVLLHEAPDVPAYTTDFFKSIMILS